MDTGNLEYDYIMILLFIFACLQGNMSISVTHGGDPIPKSPFHITVAPPLDIGKVKVDGLDNSKFQTFLFIVKEQLRV